MDREELLKKLPDYLVQQRWFADKAATGLELEIAESQVLRTEWPQLLRMVVQVNANRYSVFVGCRPIDEPVVFLEGSPEVGIGEVSTPLGPGYAYGALRDTELALHIFRTAAPELPAPTHVRPIVAEQSNTSLIYDDAWVLKIFRRLPEGPNLDVEMSEALWNAGFRQLPEPLAVWEHSGTELAVVRPLLVGGTDGWMLSQTSLRDLYASKGSPAKAGGDFAWEAERLGEMTGRLHNALAEAFGVFPGDAADWVQPMMAQLARTPNDALDAGDAGRVFDTMKVLTDVGPAIRAHGDYHLGQVMRTDEGWFVIDFEGEPERPAAERRQPSSPLKDVAGMLRSFQYAARLALVSGDEELDAIAEAWEERNREAFLNGYLTETSKDLLPPDPTTFRALLGAYELDKAIYEIAYEKANRPEWVNIPIDAARKLTTT